MAVLFLDPLALGLLVALLVYVWLVWRGTFQRWLGRDDAWTVLCWPVPLLAIVVPPVAGGLLWLGDALGVGVGEGGVAEAAVYAAVYLVPVAALAVWPPRWLLPGWARRRLASMAVVAAPDVPTDAMPAVRADRGHGSRGRWVWLVDGLAGHVWVDGPTLRFRSSLAPSERIDLDEEMVAELRFAEGGDLRLATPRGGWWSRSRLDIELREVDRLRFRAAVPWRRDGLVTVEVGGRRPVQLWVADVGRLRRVLTGLDRAGPGEAREQPA